MKVVFIEICSLNRPNRVKLLRQGSTSEDADVSLVMKRIGISGRIMMDNNL